MTKRWYWLTTERMTVGVETENGRIIRTPPIIRKFQGQPIGNLVDWMRRQPGFRTNDSRAT
jgi:hypothetical protein